MGIVTRVLGSLIRRGGGRSTQNLISVNYTLGNVLLTGNSKAGKEVLMRNYMMSAISENNSGGIVIRNSAFGFSAIPSLTMQSSMVYGIDNGDGAFTECFDPLLNLNDKQAVDLIFNMLNKYSEFENSCKMKFKEYIAKIRYFTRLMGKPFKINLLHNYTIEILEDMNYNSNLPDAEKRRHERFFDNVRGDIGTLESYFYDFEQNNIGFILSGDRSLEDILNTGKILEINIDFANKCEESQVLMSVLADCICQFNYSRARNSNICIAMDEIPNEFLLKAGIDKLLIASNQCHMIYSVEDIGLLAEKTNTWIDKADSFFFFQQNSNKNKEYCSEFFDTYEKEKLSTTRTSGSSRNSSSSYSYSSGGYGSDWSSSSSSSSSSGYSTNYSRSYTTTTEKERVYLPEVFHKLSENQCIYFFKNSGNHGYLTVY